MRGGARKKQTTRLFLPRKLVGAVKVGAGISVLYGLTLAFYRQGNTGYLSMETLESSRAVGMTRPRGKPHTTNHSHSGVLIKLGNPNRDLYVARGNSFLIFTNTAEHDTSKPLRKMKAMVCPSIVFKLIPYPPQINSPRASFCPFIPIPYIRMNNSKRCDCCPVFVLVLL